MRKELTSYNRPSAWFHMVLVLQDENREIHVYHNKVKRSESFRTIHRGTNQAPFTLGSGKTVIGKKFTDKNQNYGSVAVDELAMWNRALSEAEVAQIYDLNMN